MFLGWLCVLQGARILYERESTIDIDYSDLEDKLKKVLQTTDGITFLPRDLMVLVCLSVRLFPSPVGTRCGGSEGDGRGAQRKSDPTPDQPAENRCS